MNLQLELQVATDDDDHPPPASFEQWVVAAIGDRLKEAQVCVRIVSEQEITELNFNYRAKNKPTNVLSFCADLPDYVDIPLMGDLVLCAKIVEKEAIAQGKPLRSHWAHLVIHGTLHLLGYDHIDDNDAKIMEELEVEILHSLDISNPYLMSH